MKAITIHQPYASLIGWGEKRYETRSWSTPYRGPIAIHAGKSHESFGILSRDYHFRMAVKRHGDGFPFGSVVAIGELTNVHFMTDAFIHDMTKLELTFGYYSVGRFAWQIDNIRLLVPPITAKGQQGMWDWTAPEPRRLTKDRF
jgi:hypothetical protein